MRDGVPNLRPPLREAPHPDLRPGVWPRVRQDLHPDTALARHAPPGLRRGQARA
jgi:hypothetical protein